VRSLKIDKSFVMEMDNDANDHVIVQSTIDLAHGIGLSAVAEGVESDAILKELSLMGCDTAQGYYISRPLPAARFVEWVHQSRWKLASLPAAADSSQSRKLTVH